MGPKNLSVAECTINLTRIFILQPKMDWSYFIGGPLLATVVFGGLICNVVCLLVFCKSANRPRIYIYLTVLTIWDIALLISSFLLYSLPVLLHGRFYIFGAYVQMYPFFYTIANITHSGSIWTTVILAVERYMALCRPMKHIMWDTNSRAKLLLSVVALFSVLYQVPKYFEIHIKYCLEEMSGKRITIMASSRMRENYIYKCAYKFFGGIAFFSVGPLFTLLVLTFKVSIAIKHILEFQKISTNKKCVSVNNLPIMIPSQKKAQSDVSDKNMDMMLVAVMVKFCICHTLPVMLDMCETFLTSVTLQGNIFGTLVDISNVLVVANSSCNFALYCIFGSKFRRNFKEIFSSLLKKERYFSYKNVKSISNTECSKISSGSRISLENCHKEKQSTGYESFSLLPLPKP